MSTTATTLRPFDKTDFQAFAGVETANPLIGFHEHQVVVVDGCHLEFVTMDADFDPTSYVQDYQCAATAEAVGNDILALLAQDGSMEGIAAIVDRFSLQAI